jgi:choline-sulfatase
VVFTVDHGDFAGQYGLFEKWDTCMADCLLRVPFVLWSPDLPHGTNVEGLTQHVDLPPTVLELLGIEPDWGIHGRSLLTVARGESPGRETVFADGGHEREMQERFSFPRTDAQGRPKRLSSKQVTYMRCPQTMARTKMARSERWKLVTRLVGGNELYDMQEDPWELHNLWGEHERDPELMRVVVDLQDRMIRWCTQTDTDRPHQEQVGA